MGRGLAWKNKGNEGNSGRVVDNLVEENARLSDKISRVKSKREKDAIDDMAALRNENALLKLVIGVVFLGILLLIGCINLIGKP